MMTERTKRKAMNCLLLRQYIRLNCWGRESWIRWDTGLGLGGVGGTSHLPILKKEHDNVENLRPNLPICH